MESFLETVDLDIEESNELLFKVKVEGIDQAPAKVRLVCENGDEALMFNGHPTKDDGVVQFLLPVLKGKLKEGQYLSRVEVLIENRYFAPVQFNINLKQAVKVVAEAVRIPEKKAVPRVSVTASAPTLVRKTLPPPAPAPVVVESKPAVIEAPKQPEKKPETKRPFAPRLPGTQKHVPAPSTLRERYARKAPALVETVSDDDGEELIKELARSFVRTKK